MSVEDMLMHCVRRLRDPSDTVDIETRDGRAVRLIVGREVDGQFATSFDGAVGDEPDRYDFMVMILASNDMVSIMHCPHVIRPTRVTQEPMDNHVPESPPLVPELMTSVDDAGERVLSSIREAILAGSSIGTFVPVGTDIMRRLRDLATELGAIITAEGKVSAREAAKGMGIPNYDLHEGEVEFVRLDPPGSVAVENKGEQRLDDIDAEGAARLIERSLRNDFCHDGDWDDRWRADRYYVNYRIGSIVETFSFAPSEVAESIRVTAEEVFLFICHRVAREQGETSVNIARVVDELGASTLTFMEFLVRWKHGLDLGPLEPPANKEARIIRRLIKHRLAPRNEDERRMRLTMLFGAILQFARRPAEHNLLEIIDRDPSEYRSSTFRHPALLEKASMIGFRSFESRQVAVN
jgi:hypothetical protein